MNCQEFHAYFSEMHIDAARQSSRAEVTEHIATCVACNQFVEAHRELQASLRLTREAVPQMSADTDGAVLANYRRYLAETAEPTPFIRVHRSRLVFALCAAGVAAALIVAAVMFLPGRNTVQKELSVLTTPVAKTPQLPSNSAAAKTVAPDAKPKKVRPVMARHRAPANTPAIAGSSLPTGFRTLMYCDELICAGPMDVIRVQLPRSAFPNLAPASPEPNDVVFADVLVGADGIARGIRLEQ